MPELEAGLLPPRYRGAKLIGRGGMGEIYRATDSSLGRAVAIKLLSERYAENEDVRGRFTREALAAARLSGVKCIVTIFDVGEWAERPYIVMEYLSGGTLDDRVREEGAVPPRRALAWLGDAASALDAAHREGIVHRDVKPGNLLLDREGNVHVADFGIASAMGMDSMTMTGTVLGTAGYLAPEQAQGKRATPASDRYGLGVVAFELLTGTRPFASDSVTAEATAHVHAPVPSADERNPELPVELDGVFAHALAKDPEVRFPTCADFVAELRNALDVAAGETGRIAPVTAATRITRAPMPRPRIDSRALLAGLFVLAAIGGIALVALLTRGGGSRTVVRTVVSTAQGTTVHVRETVAAPTPPPTPPAPTPPPPAPPAAASDGSGHSLNDQGFSLMQNGDYAGALPLLQSAVQKLQGAGPSDPYEGYANYNLGYTLVQLGRCDEALPYLQAADGLEPGNGDVQRALQRARHCH